MLHALSRTTEVLEQTSLKSGAINFSESCKFRGARLSCTQLAIFHARHCVTRKLCVHETRGPVASAQRTSQHHRLNRLIRDELSYQLSDCHINITASRRVQSRAQVCNCCNAMCKHRTNLIELC